MASTPWPMELHVHAGSSSTSPLFTLQMSQESTEQSLLAICQSRLPQEHLGDKAWFENDQGAPFPADVSSSPASAVLSATPGTPHRLVFASSTATADQPEETASSSQQQQQVGAAPAARHKTGKGWAKWSKWALKVAVTSIKVIVVAETAFFLLERARVLRYMGRQERWGPGSDAASGESDVGTSSEAADLLLDYMQDEVGLDALQGFTPAQMDRALDKINSEDLAELGVPEAHEQLALIRNTMREAKEAGAAGVKNVKKK